MRLRNSFERASAIFAVLVKLCSWKLPASQLGSSSPVPNKRQGSLRLALMAQIVLGIAAHQSAGVAPEWAFHFRSRFGIFPFD
ncbi:MAG: hypothetical protein CXZ00_08350 [Acidobacteria bacterium]|nr:MAG: hypothetical protein CXZ00_08350 [Acidobacteriota bacterium]